MDVDLVCIAWGVPFAQQKLGLIEFQSQSLNSSYQCHVGHGYSITRLVVEQPKAVETALSPAVRVLEERAALARQMAAQAHQQQRIRSEARLLEQAHQISRQSELIRQVISVPQSTLELGG